MTETGKGVHRTQGQTSLTSSLDAVKAAQSGATVQTSPAPATDQNGAGDSAAKPGSGAAGAGAGAGAGPKAVVDFANLPGSHAESLQSKMWADLTLDQRRAIAHDYFTRQLAQLDHAGARTEWAIDPDLALLNRAHPGEVPALAASLLRARHGISSKQDELDDTVVASRRTAVEAQEQAVEAAKKLVGQIQAWTNLAKKVPRLLVASLIGAVVFTVLAFVLTLRGRMNGAEFAVTLFVIGVMSISPSVLLLLERPLKGIDTFTPGALPSGGAQAKAAAASDPAGSAAGKSTPTAKAKAKDAATAT